MSDNLGLGVMIGMLGGNSETVDTIRAAIGKKISRVWLAGDALHFRLEDGTGFRLSDEGQSCCESRYMVVDDDLEYHAGAVLKDVQLREAAPIEGEYEVHEVQFLEVHTDKGVISAATHNEHNGYYGGFWIVAKPEADN
jgi:hypothetical protein